MAYRRVAGVRLRPVPELGMCLAFTPAPPRLHTLNPAAWLIAELCGGAAGAALETEFLQRSVPPLAAADALGQLQDGLALLQQFGIVESFTPEKDAL